MIYRINTVVLKDAYSKVFRYELIVCAGFTNVLRLPAPSSPLSFVANVMWEVIQEIDAMTK